MRMRADVVRQDSVRRQFVAESIYDRLRGKVASARSESALQADAMFLPCLLRPIVGERLKPIHCIDGAIQIAGLVPDEVQSCARFGYLGAHVDHMGFSHP